MILVLVLQGTAYSVLVVFSLSLLAMNMHTTVNIKLNLEIEIHNFDGTKTWLHYVVNNNITDT